MTTSVFENEAFIDRYSYDFSFFILIMGICVKTTKYSDKEKFEDTKGVIRNRKSKKDGQYNGQKKKDGPYNGQKKKDGQYNGQKKKDGQYNDQKKKGGKYNGQKRQKGK
jgi:hypothetical protein